MALEHDQEKVNESEKHSTRHQQTNRPNVPSGNRDAEVEMANRELEEAVGDHIE